MTYEAILSAYAMPTNKKLITIFVLALVGFMVSGSAASANAATIQKLPTCTDPTGQNLPCMIVISTLPPPPNAVQCQETSGTILSCSYGTQNLSNGNEIVVITVYVPANFVFSDPEVIKVVVYKTTTKIIRTGDSDGDKNCHPLFFFHSQCPIRPHHLCEQGFHPIFVDGMRRCVPDKPIYDCSIHAKGCDGEVYCSLVTTQKSCYDEADCPNKSPYCNPTPSGGPGKGVIGKKLLPPAVDCNTNPNDPSCTQSLTPPPTKTCPDGSVIDTSGSCRTQVKPAPNLGQGLTPDCGTTSKPCESAPPTNTPPSPDSNNPTPPSDNNPSSPSSSDNGNPGGGSSSGGSGSDKGSSTPQPGSVS
ncbi:MAG: hypothetical protein WCF23_17200 [Candidatus Nitrosopolaris sp.]